jgi:sensor histidine kinase YesM
MNIKHISSPIPSGDWLLRFLTLSKYQKLRRTIALILPLILFLNTKRWGEYSGIVDHLDWVSFYLVWIGMVFINVNVLIPKLFNNGKSIYYLLLLSLTITCGWLVLFSLRELIWNHFRLLPKINPDETILTVILGLIILTPLFLVSAGRNLLERWISDAHRIDELENQALQSELKALRNQIQPHFLFNMLNGILAVNRTEPELASRIILKLSDFLRYLIYDSNHSQVYLSAEIRFINDFLELEKMRRDNFIYDIKYEPSQVMGVKIPPHVLLTLVENAIKHSSDSVLPSCVKISLSISERRLTIFCENSVPLHESDPVVGGIGLANINRRLQLLFADKFEYLIDNVNDRYTVNLSIPV